MSFAHATLKAVPLITCEEAGTLLSLSPLSPLPAGCGGEAGCAGSRTAIQRLPPAPWDGGAGGPGERPGVKSGPRGSAAGPLPPPRAAETALTEAWWGLWWLWVSPSPSPCTRGQRAAGCRACGVRAGAGAQCVGQRECICGAFWDASPAVQTDFNFKW